MFPSAIVTIDQRALKIFNFAQHPFFFWENFLSGWLALPIARVSCFNKTDGLSRLLGRVSRVNRQFRTELFAIRENRGSSRAIVFLLYNTRTYVCSTFPSCVLFINRAYEGNVNFEKRRIFLSCSKGTRVWINNLVSSWIFLPRNLSRRTELFAVVPPTFLSCLPQFSWYVCVSFEISNYLWTT